MVVPRGLLAEVQAIADSGDKLRRNRGRRGLDVLNRLQSSEAIDIDADTTFVLMLEAQRRGHEVLTGDPRDLLVEDGAAVARLRPVTLRRERGNHADLGPERTVLLDRDVDLLFQRKDPPVDADYVTALQILTLCRRTLVLNRPQGVLAANEKLYAVHFPDLMPETRVTRSITELLSFLAKLGGEMIVKPLDGKGGEGIFHLHREDRNLNAILEQATAFGTRWIMAQRYLREIRSGDKRILLLEGEPIGAFSPRWAGETTSPRQSARRWTRGAGGNRRRRSSHRPSTGAFAAPRRPLLRRNRRDRGDAHRGQRDEPDGHAGDQHPRGRPTRGAGDRTSRGEGRGARKTGNSES